MKKVLSVIMALILACLFIAVAGAEESAFLGTWYLHGMIDDEESIDVAAAGIYGSLVLNSDNTAVFEVAGDASEGTWKYDGSELWITIEDDPAEANFSDDEMQVFGGDQILIFNREATSAIRLSTVNTDAKEEDFNGNWECALVSISGVVLDASQFDATGDMSLPSFSFQDGKIKQTNDIDTSMFDMTETETIPWEFKDGTYSCVAESEQVTISFRINLLQDGMLAYVVDTGDNDYGLYFNRVEDGTPVDIPEE